MKHIYTHQVTYKSAFGKSQIDREVYYQHGQIHHEDKPAVIAYLASGHVWHVVFYHHNRQITSALLPGIRYRWYREDKTVHREYYYQHEAGSPFDTPEGTHIEYHADGSIYVNGRPI
tara:strand:+ start:820 stop:1170 length:351 start_codon:yes stop_codon:yes gene_type:complete